MQISQLLQKNGFAPTGDYTSQTSLAEQALGLSFASDFRRYLTDYGQLTINEHEFTGILMQNYSNVVKATNAELQYIKHNKKIYVVELLGVDGIVIWQDEDGKIFQGKPGGELTEISPSFSAYLLAEVL